MILKFSVKGRRGGVRFTGGTTGVYTVRWDGDCAGTIRRTDLTREGTIDVSSEGVKEVQRRVYCGRVTLKELMG